jgi:hypothetical protein
MFSILAICKHFLFHFFATKNDKRNTFNIGAASVRQLNVSPTTKKYFTMGEKS